MSIRIPSQSAIWCWPSGQERRNRRSRALPSAPVIGAGARRGLSAAMRSTSCLKASMLSTLEADVIHPRRDDAGALVVRDVPGHDDERHMPIRQVVVGVIGLLVGLRQ